MRSAANGWLTAISLAIGLTIIQAANFAWLAGRWLAFPVQVRVAYLILLVTAQWEPLNAIYWVQRIGTWARVLFGYCLLARLLSLAPWNRSVPFSMRLIVKTFFLGRPGGDSIRTWTLTHPACQLSALCPAANPANDCCEHETRTVVNVEINHGE